VIAALLAVLKKVKQTAHAKVVHAGWISAVVAGALTFLFARKALAGADRELLEGVAALLAVAMLLYAAVWLNARAQTRKFMGEIRDKMQGALGRGSVLGLFAISFTAMFRESFETALFLQGLSIDSPSGAAYGALGGLVGLLGLVVFVNQVGYRLPMKALFNASTAVLLITSVILLGKGLHALQEVGTLPLRPIPMFQLELLGIYPDALSLVPQTALALAILIWLFASRKAKTPTAHDGSPEVGSAAVK
jgi:high-affinity iron transporter